MAFSVAWDEGVAPVVSSIRLQQGEEVVLDMLPSAFWTAPLYVITFGLWAIWRSRHRFILTNQRVLIVQGIVTRREKALPLSRVQDVRLIRSYLIGGRVLMSSAGGALSIQAIGPLSRERARVFADAVGPRIDRGGDGLSPPPATPAQWAVDPFGQADLRYWDGYSWTDHVSPVQQEDTAGPPA
ncbi:MAG: PH domain-containing protein [Acidimicrobiales bacterium]